MDFSKMGKLLDAAKKAGEYMQHSAPRMAAAKAKLEALSLEGVAGAGMVRARFSGAGRCTAVEIDPAIVGKKSVVEDLVRAAVNDALSQVDAAAADVQQQALKDAMSDLPRFLDEMKKPPSGGA
jgi:nucleoid-associated protein EbfC